MPILVRQLGDRRRWIMFINKDDWKVVKLGEWFRFVDHNNKLLTTGFKSEYNLIKNSDIIRTSGSSIAIMQDRYQDYY